MNSPAKSVGLFAFVPCDHVKCLVGLSYTNKGDEMIDVIRILIGFLFNECDGINVELSSISLEYDCEIREVE